MLLPNMTVPPRLVPKIVVVQQVVQAGVGSGQERGPREDPDEEGDGQGRVEESAYPADEGAAEEGSKRFGALLCSRELVGA